MTKVPSSRLNAIVEQPEIGRRFRKGDVLLTYERTEYITGEKLNAILVEIGETLAQKNVSSVSCRSAQNIVFELAFNSFLHRKEDIFTSELLVIALRNGRVEVWMFGGGRATQVDRLQKIISQVGAIAKPPNHQEALLAERDARAWRRRKLSSSNSQGSGLGMMTIAALSTEPLFFLQNKKGRESSFALQSVI